jgi:ribosome-binding protein aMBF1 (putative translation factor)
MAICRQAGESGRVVKMSRRLDHLTEKHCRSVAERIKVKRQAAGLSINRLSEMAGMSQCMISYIEQGKRVPTIATLFRIATALEMEPEELIRSESKA